jgi:lysyl-tRNA synthetase class 2
MPSSVIRRYRYDEVRRRLDITFVSGENYSYFDVPATVVSGLARARSKGRFFQQHIRNGFAYRAQTRSR